MSTLKRIFLRYVVRPYHEETTYDEIEDGVVVGVSVSELELQKTLESLYLGCIIDRL